MKTHVVQANGIRMHVTEKGEGPLVLLLHGFPELGYSWRHQLTALANAGYRVAAPDQRGYGKTDQPEAVNQYTLCHLVSDVVGLVRALGESRAVVVGHDWGSAVAWTAALLRPDIFHAVGLLSVPYVAGMWTAPPPTVGMKQLLANGQMLYQLYFQEPGAAEHDFAENPRDSMLRIFVAASGGIPPEQRWRYLYPAGENFMDTLPKVSRRPDWLQEHELEFFTEEFTRTGFTGGLNWYRNMDRDRELLAFLAGSRIMQPSVFIAGEEDLVIQMNRRDFDRLHETMPGLTSATLISGAGHWVQQEKPEEVNTLLLQFLSKVFAGASEERMRASSAAATPA